MLVNVPLGKTIISGDLGHRLWNGLDIPQTMPICYYYGCQNLSTQMMSANYTFDGTMIFVCQDQPLHWPINVYNNKGFEVKRLQRKMVIRGATR